MEAGMQLLGCPLDYAGVQSSVRSGHGGLLQAI